MVMAEPSRIRHLAVALVAGLLGACSSAPPQAPDNVCAVFEEKPRWYRHAIGAEREWGIPVHVSMAFVHRESSYVADARPPRGRILWVIPWRRPSSAYGYAQATRGAWEDYIRDTGRRFAGRDSFADAMDFIGWYNHRSARQLGIPKDDPYRLYLAYHEGPTGYQRGTWRGKPNVQGYASKVQQRAQRYQAQLDRCRDDLGRGFWRRLF
jgi:hypothetical protein